MVSKVDEKLLKILKVLSGNKGLTISQLSKLGARKMRFDKSMVEEKIKKFKDDGKIICLTGKKIKVV